MGNNNKFPSSFEERVFLYIFKVWPIYIRNGSVNLTMLLKNYYKWYIAEWRINGNGRINK